MKVNKATITDIDRESLNQALQELYAVLQGRVDFDNLLENVSIPEAQVYSYPTPTDPIDADKLLIKSQDEDLDPGALFQNIINQVGANIDYTVLSGSTTISFVEGDPKVKTVQIRIDKPVEIATIKDTSRSDNAITHTSFVRVDKNFAGSYNVITRENQRFFWIKNNTAKTRTVKALGIIPLYKVKGRPRMNSATVVNGVETIETLEEIVFNVTVSLSKVPETDEFVNVFVDVDVLCEVLP